MAITAPMAARWSPSASRTRTGTNVLSSGPVTPAKSPPSPTSAHTQYARRDEFADGTAAATGMDADVDSIRR